MVSGLSDRFGHYLPPTTEMIRRAITSGLVIFDTNVLLSAYRFAPAARGELLSAMEKVGDRLWVPDQVAYEFHKNRLAVVAEHDAAYQPVIDALAEQQRVMSEEVAGKIRVLANRVALSEDERKHLLKLVATSLSEANKAVEELRARHGLKQPFSSDPILKRLERMFAGKVGEPMAESDRRQAEEEAERRKDTKEPPGYKDPEGIGDYLVWVQSLVEAAKRSTTCLTFVTSDVKEDWYRIVKGKTVSARPELIEEARSVANTQLVMLNIKSFLYHAGEYLNTPVSKETLRQADATPDPVEIKVRHHILQSRLRDLEHRRNLFQSRYVAIDQEVEAARENVVSLKRQLHPATYKQMTVEYRHNLRQEIMRAEGHLEKALRAQAVAAEDLATADDLIAQCLGELRRLRPQA